MKDILVKCDRCGQEFLMRDLRPLRKKAPKGICLECMRKEAEVYRKCRELEERGARWAWYDRGDPDEKHDSMQLLVNDSHMDQKRFYAEVEATGDTFESLRDEIIRQADEAGIPRDAYYFYDDIYKEVWGKYPTEE